VPILVASYTVNSAAANTTALATSTFTPTPGEIIVVKMATEDSTFTIGAPTGGGLTYTSRGTQNAAGRCWCALYTAVAVGGTAGMAVTQGTVSGASWHSLTVERWRNAKLATSPATVNATGTSAPNTTLTTVAPFSVVSWLNTDWTATAGARTYRSGAVEDGYHNSAGYTVDYAYQETTTAGSQTVGLTAPASQTWGILGVEVQHQAAVSRQGLPASMTRAANW